jgi:hypothetical protein
VPWEENKAVLCEAAQGGEVPQGTPPKAAHACFSDFGPGRGDFFNFQFLESIARKRLFEFLQCIGGDSELAEAMHQSKSDHEARVRSQAKEKEDLEEALRASADEAARKGIQGEEIFPDPTSRSSSDAQDPSQGLRSSHVPLSATILPCAPVCDVLPSGPSHVPLSATILPSGPSHVPLSATILPSGPSSGSSTHVPLS